MFLFFWKLNSWICKILVLFLICSFGVCDFSPPPLLFPLFFFLFYSLAFHFSFFPKGTQSVPQVIISTFTYHFHGSVRYFRSNYLQSPGIKYIPSYSKDRLRINERKILVLSLCLQGKGELESRLTQIMKEGFYPSSWQNKWYWTRPPTVSNQQSTPKNLIKYVK